MILFALFACLAVEVVFPWHGMAWHGLAWFGMAGIV